MPAACSSSKKGDDAAVRSDWEVKPLPMLCVIICSLVLIGFLSSNSALLYRNLGWIALARGFDARLDSAENDLEVARGWFLRAATVEISGNTYHDWCLAALDLPGLEKMTECNWEALEDSPRGRVFLKSALLFAMRRLDQQDLSTSDLNLSPSQVKAEIALYKQLTEVLVPDIGEILRLVAQGIIDGRTDNLAFWQQEIRRHYPGQEYASLHDLQNSFTQIVIAEKIHNLGAHNEAIRVGEQAVASNHWHWGHYVVAGFYLREGQPAQAERHLLQAISYGEPDPLIARYRVELADLYAKQHQIAAAQEQYCRAIQEIPPGTSDDSGWRRKAISGLSRLRGVRNARRTIPLCSW